MKNWFAKLICTAITLLSLTKADASHLFGADLYYTHVSGNTYTINMVVYGDCSGSPAAFNGLFTATPEIEVYNNGSFWQTIALSPTSTGIEVTPVCPAQINNTTCNGGSIPGIRKFVYSASINLFTTSTNWLFRFTGELLNSTVAGRSNSITNVFIPGTGSPMILEATLNNSVAPNSSPIYTTIPTPFFCINKPAQYNPGAVDANNDALTFSLVSGLTTGGAPVTYLAPFTATQPLGTAAGTFSFSTTTGQLNFNPNIVQNSLVVGRVEEYRNGVLIGTSMREMTFVVLNNCNNNPPLGGISNPSGGVVLNSTTFRACQGQNNVSFTINPADLDGDVINVVTAGLPTGATATVTGNNTAAPSISFSWPTANVAVGSYTFFVTYTDDGCPLSSKQTIAYTVTIAPKPTFAYTQIAAATCVKKAVYNVAATGTAPFTLSVLQGSATIQATAMNGTSHTDSLAPGTYTIRIANSSFCFKDTTITILPPPTYNATYTMTPSCASSGTGTLSAVPSGGVAPYQYALGTGAFGSNPVFSNLPAGTHLYRIRDNNHCIKDTLLTISTYLAIIPAVSSLSNTLCPGQSTGSFTITASAGLSPYTYALNSGAFGSTNTFNNLAAGNYVVQVKDGNNCIKDTSVVIGSPAPIVPAVPLLTNALCNGQASGSFTIAASGGTSPYTFAFNGGGFGNTMSFSNLAAGSYLVTVKDANNCTKDTTVFISQPTSVTASVTLTQPLCHGGNNGMISVTGVGGTPGYTYALGAGAFNTSSLFTNISAGNYVLHIRDVNNCTYDTTVTMTQPAPVAISFSASNARCAGEASGSITINGSGGTPAYTYAANGGAFQPVNTITGLLAGVHNISVRDNNGCQKDTVATIAEPNPLMFSAVSITNPTCVGFTDGQVTMVASGGTGPYTFSKDGGNFGSNATFAALPEGTYQFSIRDNNGCQKDTSLTLEGYPEIIIDNIIITPASCFGQPDGAFEVSASGGNQPLTYSLNGTTPSAAGQFSNLTSATYIVEIEDDKGCTIDTSLLLPSPQVLSIRMDVVNNDCIGTDNNGSITAVVTGGNQPYSFQWNNAQKGDAITGLTNGIYAVEVVDAKGCTDTAAAEVTYDDCCTVFVPSAFTPNNDGKNDQLSVLYKGDMKLQQLSIFNRFGQRVFYTNNINDKWDGIFNGQPQELGTYFYYLTVICGNTGTKTQIFKGDVILVR